MPDNAQKTPIQTSLQLWGSGQQESFKQLQGKRIPCSVVSVDGTGTIVVVKFEILSDVLTLPQVEMPVQTTEYSRAPIRAGTKGYAQASEYYLGGVTDMGGGNAGFEEQPNLSNLTFVPLGSTSFSDTPNPDWHWVNGPDGVLISNADQTVSLLLTTAGGIELNGPLGMNLLKGNWTEATSDADAKSKGIPFDGVYKTADGLLHWQRIP